MGIPCTYIGGKQGKYIISTAQVFYMRVRVQFNVHLIFSLIVRGQTEEELANEKR